jgi:hypothetical protein
LNEFFYWSRRERGGGGPTRQKVIFAEFTAAGGLPLQNKKKRKNGMSINTRQ